MRRLLGPASLVFLLIRDVQNADGFAMNYLRRATGLVALALVTALTAAACGSAEPTMITATDDLGVSADDGFVLDEADLADDAARDADVVADDSAPVVIPASDVAALLEANASAKEQWLASGIVDYDVTIRPDINEVVFDVTVADAYEVEVRGGEITRVFPEDVFSSELDDFLLPHIFDEIDNSLRADSDGDRLNVAVEYDPITGFITQTQQFFPSGYVATVQFVNFREPSAYPNECTASGEVGVPSVVNLSGPVAAKRGALIGAAAECDFLLLSSLASHGDGYVETTFGGAGVERIWHGEAAGEELLTTMIELLNGRPAETEFGWVWPAEFADPESDYLGWRIGIDVTGDWAFFIAGD